jgi:hypothetical protein
MESDASTAFPMDQPMVLLKVLQRVLLKVLATVEES